MIDRIIVSTDNQEIRDIYLSYGAEAPFIRPKEIADDTTGDFEVVYHHLNWLQDHDQIIPDSIIYLRPDFPFRQVDTLNRAIETYMKDKKADGLRSVQ